MRMLLLFSLEQYQTQLHMVPEKGETLTVCFLHRSLMTQTVHPLPLKLAQSETVPFRSVRASMEERLVAF